LVNMKVRFTVSGGSTVDLDLEDGATIRDVLKEVRKQIGDVPSGMTAVNGYPAEEDEYVEDGDIVSITKSPKGG